MGEQAIIIMKKYTQKNVHVMLIHCFQKNKTNAELDKLSYKYLSLGGPICYFYNDVGMHKRLAKLESRTELAS